MSKMRTATAAVAGIAVAAGLSLGLASSASASTTTTSHSAAAPRTQADPPGIYAPNIPIVINRSNQALTITSLAVDRGAASAY